MAEWIIAICLVLWLLGKSVAFLLEIYVERNRYSLRYTRLGKLMGKVLNK